MWSARLISFLEVLGREEDGDTALDQLPDDLPHGASTSGVETGGGLVQEDDLRSSDQRHCQVEPSTHAAREVDASLSAEWISRTSSGVLQCAFDVRPCRDGAGRP